MGSKNVYASVKSFSKKGRLLKKADFQTLAESRDLDELMTRIKNTIYGNSVSDVQKPYTSQKIENALKMSPYIKEAIAIGDRRKFISALIQIDLEATGDWATRNELGYTSFEDLASKPEVDRLIHGEVQKSNERLVRVEQVRRFTLLPKELHQDDGELTATQKVRRRAVNKKFIDLIDSMYGGSHD